MAYTVVPTQNTGDLWSAANHNQYIKDNFAAGVPDSFTTKGDLFVATAADVGARQGVGANGGFLVANSAVTNGLQWSDTFAGPIFLNDTANASMTTGLTLNQGAADDEILAFKSSDVAHGVTTGSYATETDTYGTGRKATALNGGLSWRGYTEDAVGLELVGVATLTDSAKTTAGVAPIYMTSLKKSGTGTTELAANENVFAVFGGGGTRFIVDADGDIFAIGGQVFANGDTGGVASMTGLTNASNVSGNSTGVGTILFKGTTSRNSTGFIKIYVGVTAYYIPFFDAITG